MTAVPPDHRVYAVGDIHGCLDLLLALEDQILQDAAAAPESRRTIVYLGDYVDRGPDCAGVIDHLIRPRDGFERVFLRGNHEDFLLRFIAGDDDGVRRGELWLINGGDTTLRSYGIDVPLFAVNTVTLRDLRDRFEAALPPAHRAFLEATALSHRVGDYFFVHAGVRPDRPLDAQDGQDLMWIRDPFLWSEADLGAVVVHGHTPVSQPEIRPNRIGVDTGAVYNGRLTAVVLSGTQTSFLSAGNGGF